MPLDGRLPSCRAPADAALRTAGDPTNAKPAAAFDAPAEAARLKAETRIRRRARHTRSRLDRYAHELLALADEDCTPAELRRWLRDRHVHVHHSTVARWLRRHGDG